MSGGCPTPREDVNALLRVLQGEVTHILSRAFVGMYLSGSLALGNLTPGSDVDDDIPLATRRRQVSHIVCII
ncbi:MAG TPA: hypothetical protein VGR88_02435 [Ktedonobacterales bacterium]|nr:hypothetical protein [Ktedonobacterales bacterium]